MATRLGEQPTAAPLVPERATIDRLQDAAAGCQACDLWKTGTQTVFGDGSRQARIIFIGEQPGDEEDVQGTPFVGPAGRLLDRALGEAGIDRDDAYVTNAVKHFRWEGQRGKKRIHRKPGLGHVRACEPWLRAELRVVRPEVVVLMGATAARSLLGPAFRVTEHRGRFVETELEAIVTATVHPSSILRARDDALRRSETEAFVRDLRVAAGALA